MERRFWPLLLVCLRLRTPEGASGSFQVASESARMPHVPDWSRGEPLPRLCRPPTRRDPKLAWHERPLSGKVGAAYQSDHLPYLCAARCRRCAEIPAAMAAATTATEMDTSGLQIHAAASQLFVAAAATAKAITKVPTAILCANIKILNQGDALITETRREPRCTTLTAAGSRRRPPRNIAYPAKGKRKHASNRTRATTASIENFPVHACISTVRMLTNTPTIPPPITNTPNMANGNTSIAPTTRNRRFGIGSRLMAFPRFTPYIRVKRNAANAKHPTTTCRSKSAVSRHVSVSPTKIVEAIMNRVNDALIVRGGLGERAIYWISPSSSMCT